MTDNLRRMLLYTNFSELTSTFSIFGKFYLFRQIRPPFPTFELGELTRRRFSEEFFAEKLFLLKKSPHTPFKKLVGGFLWGSVFSPFVFFRTGFLILLRLFCRCSDRCGAVVVIRSLFALLGARKAVKSDTLQPRRMKKAPRFETVRTGT